MCGKKAIPQKCHPEEFEIKLVLSLTKWIAPPVGCLHVRSTSCLFWTRFRIGPYNDSLFKRAQQLGNGAPVVKNSSKPAIIGSWIKFRMTCCRRDAQVSKDRQLQLW